MTSRDAPSDDQATFCATLVDEWVRAGVRHAVVAPGSRSSPLALALAGEPRVQVHIHHDERAAGFIALGIGLASGRPAVVLTTSGTAAVELHPAVVEAHQALVPLIVCTANRPPELQDVGAPQTIDQTHLFGRAVRGFCAPGMPDSVASASWRSLAARAYADAAGTLGGLPPGPFHLDLAFREPLVGTRGELPPGRPGGRPWHRTRGGRTELADRELVMVSGRLAKRKGLVIAGAHAGDPSLVHALARSLGWPVLADPRSGCRLPRHTTISHADALLRHEGFARRYRPDVALRLGAPPASRVVQEWLASLDVLQLAVSPPGVWWDPYYCVDLTYRADPTAVCKQLAGTLRERGAHPEWLASWRQADTLAASVIKSVLEAHPEATEPSVAHDLVAELAEDATLVVASSMPVRDVEWYAEPRGGVRVVANRGANGIDGVVSTAVGVALAQRASGRDHAGPPSTVALVGDIAFHHDATALLALRGRDVDLTVVVIDNDGGGIFSFLPQADTVPAGLFEQVFGTPHGTAPESLATAYGLPSAVVDARSQVPRAVRSAVGRGGAAVVVVRTERAANVKVHDEMHAAVATAITAGSAR